MIALGSEDEWLWAWHQLPYARRCLGWNVYGRVHDIRNLYARYGQRDEADDAKKAFVSIKNCCMLFCLRNMSSTWTTCSSPGQLAPFTSNDLTNGLCQFFNDQHELAVDVDAPPISPLV
ncbi:hypothetical protein OH492_16540 [Vibrio chagasii]|nr:hypothetical protein [Vibrio chagasii]